MSHKIKSHCAICGEPLYYTTETGEKEGWEICQDCASVDLGIRRGVKNNGN